MNFSPNKTSIEIIKEGAFGGTYFRDIYSGINEKWYKNSWKEFVHLKNIDAKFYASDYYDVNVNKYGVKCGTSLRFWENKGWINKIDPYGWFQWYFRYWLGRRSEDDKRQINRWKRIVSRFRGILVKMIRDTGSKFDDYSITPKEDIFCKSSYQIYKPIEICNLVLWYHEGNNSANVYYDLAYPDKIAIKRIRNLKIKQVHFFFLENRQNTEHGVLEKVS